MAALAMVAACSEPYRLYQTEGLAKAACGGDEVVSLIEQGLSSCRRSTSTRYGDGNVLTGTGAVYGCRTEIETRLHLTCASL
jgi:hypothetical protein